MKKAIIFFCFLILSICVRAQQATFKAGINFNSEYISHTGGYAKINYPSMEAACELSIAKMFSFSLGYNYAVRNYEANSVFYFPAGNGIFISRNYITHDHAHALIPEMRFYLKSNDDGIFFQAGLPVVYTNRKSILTEDNHKYAYTDSYWIISACAGTGIKHRITPRLAAEMNAILTCPAYGTAGFIKCGLKLCYSPARYK